MANEFIFTNFAKSVLAGGIAAGDTTLSVAVGTGAIFPVPAAGEQFPIILANAATPNAPPFEIVYCTARTGDVMTIVRGQEGTAAANWPVGSVVSNRLTAAAYNQLALPNGPICRSQQFFSGTITLTNNAALSVLQTVPFTFPNESLTGQFLLHIYSEVTIGANNNSATFTGSITGGVLTVIANPNGWNFGPGNWIDFSASSNPDFTNITGDTATPGQYYVGTGLNAVSQPMQVFDQVDFAQVIQQVRDSTDSVNLLIPAGQPTIAGIFGAGFQFVNSGFASENPGTGSSGDDITITFAAGSTYTLKQKVGIANTGAFPIPTATATGKLILTAVPNC